MKTFHRVLLTATIGAATLALTRPAAADHVSIGGGIVFGGTSGHSAWQVGIGTGGIGIGVAIGGGCVQPAPVMVPGPVVCPAPVVAPVPVVVHRPVVCTAPVVAPAPVIVVHRPMVVAATPVAVPAPVVVLHRPIVVAPAPVVRAPVVFRPAVHGHGGWGGGARHW